MNEQQSGAVIAKEHLAADKRLMRKLRWATIWNDWFGTRNAPPSQLKARYLPLRFHTNRQEWGARIYAGPFRNCPENVDFSVNLTKEIHQPECHVRLPIEDFSVPDPLQARRALIETLYHLRLGDVVYCGCMGGIGRTGLFLSLLTKCSGMTSDPVSYVRMEYLPSAVETMEQREFVKDLYVHDILAWVQTL